MADITSISGSSSSAVPNMGRTPAEKAGRGGFYCQNVAYVRRWKIYPASDLAWLLLISGADIPDNLPYEVL